MTFIDYTGLLGALLTTLSFVPQALKCLRQGSTEGISLLMYALFVTGLIFWLLYGLLLMSWPIILANSCTLVFAGAILGMKIRHVLHGHEKP